MPRLRKVGLKSDAEWAGALALREANELKYDPTFRAFAERSLLAKRRLQNRGWGVWFGAFVDHRMVSGLGVFTDGEGVGRFQSVDTHPSYRKRGLAGMLVYTASQYAFRSLGVRTLVMVADPAADAIRLYRSLGFCDSETQIQLERVDAQEDAQDTARDR